MTREAPDADGADGTELVDAWIQGLGGWRSETMARLCAVIREADPGVQEAIKYRKPSNPDGVPVWSHGRTFCNANSLKRTVRLTFTEGATLPDPEGLFNAALNAGHMRAIDVAEGESVDEVALKDLVRAAVEQSGS